MVNGTVVGILIHEQIAIKTAPNDMKTRSTVLVLLTLSIGNLPAPAKIRIATIDRIAQNEPVVNLAYGYSRVSRILRDKHRHWPDRKHEPEAKN